MKDVRTKLQEKNRDVGAYYRFFFGTVLLDKDKAQAECAGGGPATDSESLPGFLEELLPYYSESSVRLRELMHGGADDNRWNWSVHGDRLLLCVGGGTVDGRTRCPTTALTSTLVPLFGRGLPRIGG